MRAGLVFTEFTISPDDRSRFAAWHSREHARERLAVSGVTAVERYVDTLDPLHFCCLYRARDMGVYAGDDYAGLPERASPLTREILSGLKGSRFVGETLATAGEGQAGLMLRIRYAIWTMAEAEACLAKASAELEAGSISRLEVAMPGPGGPNATDGSWLVMLQGATPEGLAEAAVRLTGTQGGELFRLEHALASE